MRAIPSILLVLALVAVPVGGAAWGSLAGREPDTPGDAQDKLMHLSPDVAATGRKVYFNAFEAIPQTSVNPNSGTLGSRVMIAPATHHRAILGAWKDCNLDGYMGFAELGITDYRAELLRGPTPCAPAPTATVPVHNDGAWVSELLPIGTVDPCEHALPGERAVRCPGVDEFRANERVLYAVGAFVWGDAGAPGDIPQSECMVWPMPPGSTTGTGAMIGWADCQSARGLANTVNEADRDGSKNLRFQDPTRPQDSSSLLNQRFPVTPFGRPGETGIAQRDTDERAVTAWDCANPKGSFDRRDPNGAQSIAVDDPSGDKLSASSFPWVVVHTLTGIGFVDEDRDARTAGVLRVWLTDEQGSYAWAPALAPRTNPEGSAWAALEHAADGPLADCDPETSSRLGSAYPGAFVESDQPILLEARKDRPSFTFKFFDGHRGLNPNTDGTTGRTTPSDGGISARDHDRGGDGPIWSALLQTDQDPQVVNRGDLKPSPARYFTYYAFLDATAISEHKLTMPLGPTATKVYGFENCGASAGVLGSPDKNGWRCDPAKWWKDQHGNDVRPTYARGEALGRLVGAHYNLRDVDCYDGSPARASPVEASLARLSPQGACPAWPNA